MSVHLCVPSGYAITTLQKFLKNFLGNREIRHFPLDWCFIVQSRNGARNARRRFDSLYNVRLEQCSRGDRRYQEIRNRHYVPNHGSVGQQIHYLIWLDGKICGIISGGQRHTQLNAVMISSESAKTIERLL